jgi:hypothetical protein
LLIGRIIKKWKIRHNDVNDVLHQPDRIMMGIKLIKRAVQEKKQ